MQVDILPVCPDDTPDHVREIWDYTVAHLDRMKLASASDRDALITYCWAVANHRAAGVVLASSTLLVKGAMGSEVPNPALRIQRESAVMIRQFAQEFGLTPSARASIEVKGDDGNEDNPFGSDSSGS